jgi:predicted RNase H-like nuclease
VEKIFVGFDSAWGAKNRGAIADLVLNDGISPSLTLKSSPIAVSWKDAISRISSYDHCELCAMAIDQPICVSNIGSCRPVERNLAGALMGDFGCGAHSSNLTNPCWAPGAQIWGFLSELSTRGYRHEPMAVPGAPGGKFYFECYPHPAILGLFHLPRILQYKVHHNNDLAWDELLNHLLGLKTADFPIMDIDSFVRPNLPRTKPTEDMLDALLCAYVAAYWWRYGTTRSTMIGDLSSGYMVTPHTNEMRQRLVRQFGASINVEGLACSLSAGSAPSVAQLPPPVPGQPENLDPEPLIDWQPALLTATDPANLWRTSNGALCDVPTGGHTHANPGRRSFHIVRRYALCADSTSLWAAMWRNIRKADGTLIVGKIGLEAQAQRK